jgi:hypothetical protein
LKVNEHCKLFKNGHLGNNTVTPWSSIVSDSWKGPRSTVILIEVLVSLTAVVLMFLATFGSHHRHRGDKFIQKFLLGAYTLSSSLLTYILGLMQSSPVKSSMYPFWAISLVALYGCTDSITAYILDTNRQGVAFLYQIVLCYAYALVIFITTWLSDGFYAATLPALLLCLTAVHKCLLRRLACRLASRSSDVDRTVADYMNHMNSYPIEGPFHENPMEDCRYLVDWPLRKSGPSGLFNRVFRHVGTENTDEVIEVRCIWRHDYSLNPELKDACLSFSLFHLLRRRFFGFACAESRSDHAQQFVLDMLLRDTDYNRAFMVIEVELAFMYDFFFTKYAALHYGLSAATFWSLASAICISLTAYAAATRAFTIRCDQAESVVMSAKTDAVITILLLSCAALVELLQPLLYWTTIWGRVSFACQYIRRERRIRRIIRCSLTMTVKDLTKIGMYSMSNKHYWQHKLGQYSFVDSVSFDPNVSIDIWEIIMSLLKMAFGTPQNLIGYPKIFHTVSKKPNKPVKLSYDVKKAIACCLKQTRGKLTNGRGSLESNGARELLWACCERHVRAEYTKVEVYDRSPARRSVRSEYTTSVILTWHIATCYVEMATLEPTTQKKGIEWKLHRDVATQLSKYCAYLLVSAPKLLPGHETDSKLLFDEAAENAYALLFDEENKCEAMKHINTTSTIFGRGVHLGKQLESMREGIRWKVLADFWAEMLLYAAPSDNVKEHIEQLAKGGEFITHLWALLSHAGILERDESVDDPDPYDSV